MVEQDEIKGIDNHWFREDGSVYVVLVREGISRFWSHLPDNVKVLKEEGPASLAMRKFVRIHQIRQVFIVSENRDRVRSALLVLFPFCKGENDS